VMIKEVFERLQVHYTISESSRYPIQYGNVTVYSDGGVKGYPPAKLNQRLANDYIMGIHFHIHLHKFNESISSSPDLEAILNIARDEGLSVELKNINGITQLAISREGIDMVENIFKDIIRNIIARLKSVDIDVRRFNENIVLVRREDTDGFFSVDHNLEYTEAALECHPTAMEAYHYSMHLQM